METIEIYENSKLIYTVHDEKRYSLIWRALRENCERGDVLQSKRGGKLLNEHVQSKIHLRFENVNGRRVIPFLSISNNYETAIKIANKAGGRKFDNQNYRGGVAWWSGEYTEDEITEKIDAILYK